MPLVLLVLWLWGSVSLSFGAESLLSGRVVGVHDGDTVTILISSKDTVKVRLSDIDAPELKQPYGYKSKQALSDMVFNRYVTVIVQGKDRYGRLIGTIKIDEFDINAEMIRQGFAWVYRKYSIKQELYRIESEARENDIGLWSLPEIERIPPWEWRKIKRSR